jgi:hypothetical protein
VDQLFAERLTEDRRCLMFVVGSLAWGMAVDGCRPDHYDVIGALVCLAGVAVIMYAPAATELTSWGRVGAPCCRANRRSRMFSLGAPGSPDSAGV